MTGRKDDHQHQVVRHLVTAPLGWKAVEPRPDYDRDDDLLDKLERERESTYDLCYVEQIPCFALVERWWCIDEHGTADYAEPGYEPITCPGPPISWVEVVPVLRLESSSFGIPGDEYSDPPHPALILAPDEEPDARWVRDRIFRREGLIEKLKGAAK